MNTKILSAADLFSRKDLVEIQVCEKEYESPELASLFDWLTKNGWASAEINWCVVGSQEFITYEISRGTEKAHLLFETYMGVKLYCGAELEDSFHDLKKQANKHSTLTPSRAARVSE